MTSTNLTTDPLIAEIVKQMVMREWEDNGKALLLARLGQALSRQGYDLRAWHKGKGLASAIEKKIGKDLQIIISPSDPLVSAALPKSVKLESDLNKYFAQPTERVSSLSVEKIRFNQRLWTAFSRTLQNGKARYFFLDSRMNFSDVPVSEASDGIRIPDEKIISGVSNKEERDKSVEQNIISWLHENRINPSAVKADAVEKKNKIEQTESVFDSIVKSLDISDLRRINIPLDIVLKLQAKHLNK